MVLNEEEIKLLNELGYTKETITTENDVVIVEDIVSRHLMRFGFDMNYAINNIGEVCEKLLNKLEDVELE